MTDELIQSIQNALNLASVEIAKAGHAGWGNACSDGALAITALLARLDAAEAAEANTVRYVLIGYWFKRECRFAGMHESETYFDDQERAELLEPLFAARAQEDKP